MPTNSNSQLHHEMHLKNTHSSGAEEWYCSICSRRFLIQWEPQFKRIVIESGDEYAAHSGGKGGLQTGSPRVDQDDEPVLSEDLRNALNEALEDIDFDDWSNSVDQ